MTRQPKGVREIKEAKAKADAERRRMLDRFKDRHLAVEQERRAEAAALNAKRDRFAALSVGDAVSAARRLRFIDLEAEEQGEPLALNRPTLQVLELFLTVLRERAPVAVLQWPRGSRDLSILHPLAMLAVLGSSPQESSGGYNWCNPVPDFRTLYYPWRGSSTGLTQRRILVERSELIRGNQLHLTRRQVNVAEATPELAKLHITLGHLNQLKLRDATKPHLAHPTLSELYSTFGALGAEEAPAAFGGAVYELLGRVRHGAELSKLHDYRSEITRPASAPFAFFGICPRASAKSALLHPALAQGHAADICLLDLGPPGLARLGPAWEREVATFLELLSEHHPETPVIAITQDVYVHRRVTRLLTQLGLADPAAAPASRPSRVIVRASENCFSPDPDIGEVSEVEFRFNSAGGHGAAALRGLSETARRSSDPVTAGILRHTMGNLRRAMSLPCGLRLAHETLVETVDGFLERRSASTVLAAIRNQLSASIDGDERQRLLDSERSIDAVFNELENDTPIGSLLAEIAVSISRKSSPSVIGFATEHELVLGRQRMCSSDANGDQIKKRIDSGFIRLTTLQALDGELAEIECGRSRNAWKRLVVVAPPQNQFAILLGRRWLPEEIVVLSDREFVDRLAGTYAALASHSDLAGPGRIGSRLLKAATAAKAEAKARDVPALDLDLEPRAPTLADERVIDLTSSGDDEDEREVVEFDLESGRTMRLRPGGLVIRHDPLADVNPFARAWARDVAKGDTIVVPNQAFVQEARAVLPVWVLAQTRVQIYHAAVEAAVSALPGTTGRAKARHVIQKLREAGARAVVEETVLDWLNAAEHKLAPPERLRPHAPQGWREFRAFMQIVNVPPELAETIWREGIEPLRIDRRRAGARMAQAFVSVLVDPHGGGGAPSPDFRERVASLRRKATEHLDGVLSVRRNAVQSEVHA